MHIYVQRMHLLQMDGSIIFRQPARFTAASAFDKGFSMNDSRLIRLLPPLFGAVAMTALTASASAAPLTTVMRVVNQAGAHVVIEAAQKAALQLNAPCAMAVVDSNGILVAFERFDGIRAGSPDLAIGKAKAAALLQRPTSEIEDKTNQGRIAFVTAGFMALRGGVPLREGNVVVGAVGIAGLNKDNDVKIATDAAAAFASAAQTSVPASR